MSTHLPSVRSYLDNERQLGITKAGFNHSHMTQNYQNCSKNSCALAHSSTCDRKSSNEQISSRGLLDLLTRSAAGQLCQPFPCYNDMPTLWLLSALGKVDSRMEIVHRDDRELRNVRGDNGIEPSKPIANEMPVRLTQRDVLMMANRAWHANTANQSDTPRIGLLVSNAPSQFNA